MGSKERRYYVREIRREGDSEYVGVGGVGGVEN